MIFQRKYQENEGMQTLCKLIVDVIMVIVLGYTLVLFTCARTTVVGSSMQSTIENGDTVLINQLAYAVTGPKRYSIIAFKVPGVSSSKVYVKRVIGLPGETIQIRDGKVYINGEELTDDVISDSILTAGIASNELVLGDDEYFVLGDNRNNSEDSRFADIGTVKKSNIVGSVWMIMSPIKNIELLGLD